MDGDGERISFPFEDEAVIKPTVVKRSMCKRCGYVSLILAKIIQSYVRSAKLCADIFKKCTPPQWFILQFYQNNDSCCKMLCEIIVQTYHKEMT